MKWIKITLALMLIAATGVGTWVVIDKLDDATFRVLVGVVLTLVIVIVVGLLFIGHGLIQAYIARRMLAQDDLSDMRQMAFIARLMGNDRTPNVNVRLPDQQNRGWPTFGPRPTEQLPFDGAYRDTTVNSEIEVE